MVNPLRLTTNTVSDINPISSLQAGKVLKQFCSWIQFCIKTTCAVCKLHTVLLLRLPPVINVIGLRTVSTNAHIPDLALHGFQGVLLVRQTVTGRSTESTFKCLRTRRWHQFTVSVDFSRDTITISRNATTACYVLTDLSHSVNIYTTQDNWDDELLDY